MKVSTAESRINGVVLVGGRFQCDSELQSTPLMRGDYTLVSVDKTLEGFNDVKLQGAGTQVNWSIQTLEVLRELIVSMEKDLISRFFKESRDASDVEEDDAPQL